MSSLSLIFITIRLNYMIYNIYKTFSNGSLGSRNDEERSELRKVM